MPTDLETAITNLQTAVDTAHGEVDAAQADASSDAWLAEQLEAVELHLRVALVEARGVGQELTTLFARAESTTHVYSDRVAAAVEGTAADGELGTDVLDALRAELATALGGDEAKLTKAVSDYDKETGNTVKAAQVDKVKQAREALAAKREAEAEARAALDAAASEALGYAREAIETFVIGTRRLEESEKAREGGRAAEAYVLAVDATNANAALGSGGLKVADAGSVGTARLAAFNAKKAAYETAMKATLEAHASVAVEETKLLKQQAEQRNREARRLVDAAADVEAAASP